MSKKKELHVQELFDGLDSRLEVKEFDKIYRVDPLLAEYIAGLVKVGKSPEAIASHITRKFPHKWPEAQMILAAARHLEREIE